MTDGETFLAFLGVGSNSGSGSGSGSGSTTSGNVGQPTAGGADVHGSKGHTHADGQACMFCSHGVELKTTGATNPEVGLPQRPRLRRFTSVGVRAAGPKQPLQRRDTNVSISSTSSDDLRAASKKKAKVFRAERTVGGDEDEAAVLTPSRRFVAGVEDCHGRMQPPPTFEGYASYEQQLQKTTRTHFDRLVKAQRRLPPPRMLSDSGSDTPPGKTLPKRASSAALKMPTRKRGQIKLR